MPTVNETIEYALQGPGEHILNYEGNVPDRTKTDRPGQELWTTRRVDVDHLIGRVAGKLLSMGINDQQYEVVRRRVITVITDPEIVED